MFVQDHHSLEELQRLTKALRLETGTRLEAGTLLDIDSSCVPVSIRKGRGSSNTSLLPGN